MAEASVLVILSGTDSSLSSESETDSDYDISEAEATRPSIQVPVVSLLDKLRKVSYRRGQRSAFFHCYQIVLILSKLLLWKTTLKHVSCYSTTTENQTNSFVGNNEYNESHFVTM